MIKKIKTILDIIVSREWEWINNTKKEIDYAVADKVCEMDGDITFGIEIEIQMSNRSGDIILEELKTKQLTKQMKVCKFNEVGDYLEWKVIKEATCDYEVISPVLNDNSKSWEEIKVVCDILKSIGATTDKNCALHIHVGHNGLLDTGVKWINLREIYKKYELITYALSAGEEDCVSLDRIEKFALPLNTADIKLWGRGMHIETAEKAIKNEYNEEKDNYSFVSNFYTVRKTGLNWNCLKDNGTLEFRTFNGTINEKLIQAYIIYVISLIKLSLNLKSIDEYKGKSIKNTNDIYYLDKHYIKNRLDGLFSNDLDKKRIYYYLKKNKLSIPQYVIKSILGEGECKCSELFF
jgi:hypothetical protein